MSLFCLSKRSVLKLSMLHWKGQKRWSRTEDKDLMKSFTAPSRISCQSLISQRAKNGSDVHRYESLDTSLLCQTLSFQHTHISDRKSLQYVLYTSISFQMLPDMFTHCRLAVLTYCCIEGLNRHTHSSFNLSQCIHISMANISSWSCQHFT